MKVWDYKQKKEVDAPFKVERFLDRFSRLCKEFDLSISHEDKHGGFIIEEYKEENIDLIKGASINISDNVKEEVVSEEEIVKRNYLRGLFETIKSKGYDTFETRDIIEKADFIDSIWNDKDSIIDVPFEEQAEKVILLSQKKTTKWRLSADQQMVKITQIMKGRLKMLHSLSDEDAKLMVEETIKAAGIEEIMKAHEEYYGPDKK